MSWLESSVTRRMLTFAGLVIVGVILVFSVVRYLGYNALDTANLYASSVLTLVLIWVYLNISEIQQEQVKFDQRQTELLEYQNKVQMTQYEPKLRGRRSTEDGKLRFDLENRGNGLALGATLKISPNSDGAFKEFVADPLPEESDFKGYLRPNQEATVYFESPEEVFEEYFDKTSADSVDFNMELMTKDAGGETSNSAHYFSGRYDRKEHDSFVDMFN